MLSLGREMGRYELAEENLYCIYSWNSLLYSIRAISSQKIKLQNAGLEIFNSRQNRIQYEKHL